MEVGNASKMLSSAQPPVNRAMDLLLLKTLEDMKQKKPETPSLSPPPPVPQLPPPNLRLAPEEREPEPEPSPPQRPRKKVIYKGVEAEYDPILDEALQEALKEERTRGLTEGESKRMDVEAQRMAEERYFRESSYQELSDYIKHDYGETVKNQGAKPTKQQLVGFLKENDDEEYLKEIERLKSEILPNLTRSYSTQSGNKTGRGTERSSFPRGRNDPVGRLSDDPPTDGTLSTIEINHMMRHRRSFKGAVPRDGILSLIDHISPKRTSSFIVNTDPSSRPGQHWVAVMILPKTERILYFDSFGERMPSDMKRDVRVLAEKVMPKSLPILKENLIKFQRANSNNCGFFAMDFIEDILDGETFPDATGFSQVIKGERDIKKYKIKKFNAL